MYNQPALQNHPLQHRGTRPQDKGRVLVSEWVVEQFVAHSPDFLVSVTALVGDSGAKSPVARIALTETSAEPGSLAQQRSSDPLQQ